MDFLERIQHTSTSIDKNAPDWPIRAQNLGRDLYSRLLTGAQIDARVINAFIGMLHKRDGDCYAVVKQVVPAFRELKQRSDAVLPEGAKQLLAATSQLAQATPGYSQLPPDQLFQGERKVYADAEEYRAGRALFDVQQMGERQRAEAKERLQG